MTAITFFSILCTTGALFILFYAGTAIIVSVMHDENPLTYKLSAIGGILMGVSLILFSINLGAGVWFVNW